MNTDTNTDLQPLPTGTTLNLATLPTRHLNIRANTSPATVGSVVFALSGAQVQNQTESVVPYALFSDNGGVYNAWTPPVGSYSLKATPYTGGSGAGMAGLPLAIGFSVIDQAATTYYTLTATVVGSGTVTQSPDQSTYASGTNVSLTATPAAGYQFAGWGGAAAGSVNPLTVSMNVNKTVTATFTVTGSSPTFYQAVNINGEAIILDGQSWTASNRATNFRTTGRLFSNQKVTLNPATDATRTGMIRSSTSGSNLMATFSSLPTGSYGVYLYVWEDKSPRVYDISVQQTVVLRSYNSGATGHWDRLGPYLASVTNGSLIISTAGSNANLSGIELWRQPSTISARVAPAPSNLVPKPVDWSGSTPAEVARQAGPALALASVVQAYPNPTRNGQFRVGLSEEFLGELSYTVLSPLGARLAAGTLNTTLVGPIIDFDFSHELSSAGLYYLIIQNRERSVALRIIRP